MNRDDVGLKSGQFILCGEYYCGKKFRFDGVDYDEARIFGGKVKKCVIYDIYGRRLWERMHFCK